jgi:hypothetical protein
MQPVAPQESLRCPNPLCGKIVRIEQSDAWCHHCGEYFPKDFAAQLPRLMASQPVFAQPPQPSLQTKIFEKANPRARAVMRRYDDAYKVAKGILAIGEAIKLVGILVALLIGAIGLVLISEVGKMGFFTAFSLAVFWGLSIWLSGVLIASQGQQQIARLDGVVCASPFLTDDEMAAAMALPE